MSLDTVYLENKKFSVLQQNISFFLCSEPTNLKTELCERFGANGWMYESCYILILLVNIYCLFSRNKILVHLAILYSVRFLSYLGHFPRFKKIMATSKRYVPPLSKSKGSAGAAAESTRRLDDLVQDSIFTVKLGSKNNYSESKSEKVILQ